jgi:hypothetical protein
VNETIFKGIIRFTINNEIIKLMAKYSTIVCINKNLNFSEDQIVEIDKFLKDIDTNLDEIFGDFEINASSDLVSKTLAQLKKKGS